MVKLLYQIIACLVVDEAGMVSNSDYLELFKIARSSNCNLILAGDEKQLTSIERGGMFEIFASTFGSYVLSDIRRQSQEWAREMALCFAKSDIAAGIVLLERHNGLKIDHTLEESMERLIDDWNSSRFTLQERLIITVGNQEVDSINQGIRELLKASGLLTGKEYRRSILGSKSDKQYEDYMVGDRILFKATDKDLQIENGEFATLVSVSNNKFVAKTDQGREIAFNPEGISFKHGYASTVYKAQGASIKDVYVLHNLAGNVRNSYVEMTRHVEQVKLYCNRQATRNMASLISQLARIDNRLASMHFKTLEDLNKMNEDKNPTIINKVGDWFKYVANDIEDRLHNNKQYYQQTVKAESLVKVVEVLQQTSINLAQNNQLQEGLNNSGKMLTNSNKQEPKINTKLQEDIMTNYASTQDNIKNKNMTNNINYDFINKQESLKLKQLLSFKAEDIAHSLLGRPNELLSNNYILRWEKDGKIAMKIKGGKAGIWYDFSKGEGGDLFTLVQRERKCNFVETKKYLQEMVGMPTVNKQDMLADLVADKSYRQDKTQNQQEQDKEAAKIKRAEGLHEKSSSILHSTNNNVARQYLGKHRGIKAVLEKFQLSGDLKINMMWDNESKQYYPALIAFARDQEGRITGGQSIYLNQETGAKADIAVNKRSFGKISGCFVEIQQDNQQGNKSRSNITIIAEGVETALSLQEAGIKGKIICSLGISNIKNYQPTKGEKIIIAADNDGQSAVSVNSVIKAKEQLTAKGAVVSVIMPQDMGDFNDMLKAQGAESIKKFIEPEIAKLISNETLNEKTTKFTESLKPVNNADNNKSQVKSIELELGKSANHDILQKFQWQIKSLERFTTKENINTALQIYKEKGIESFILYSKNSCSKAIEQKITKDLQIMKNKFAPNYNLGSVRFCDIVINDFRGKSYPVPEDYLVAIGKDKQVMQYINPQSVIGKEIKNELQNAAETQKNQGIVVKGTI